jgi:hypothetical protein
LQDLNPRITSVNKESVGSQSDLGAIQKRKFITRREGVRLANEQGIPISIGRVNKDCMEGIGPQPAGKYGPVHLYAPEEFMRYAETRVRQHAPDAS